MSTYTQIIYQIVFSTKFREPTLKADNRQELFKYISGILKNKKCHLYQVGGVTDHVHILTHLHPSVSLASLIKDIKLASTSYIKANNLFPSFKGWQEGYGAFTYSAKDKDNLIAYVKNQEAHHKQKSFLEEYKSMLVEQRVEFDIKHME